MLLVAFLSSSAENLGVLTEVLKPESIRVSGDEIYIVEGASVFVYSRHDLKLLRKFGRKGSGPGELQAMPFWPNVLSFRNGNIFMEGINKYVYLSKQGKLIKDSKKGLRLFGMLPVGKNYVVRGFPFRDEKNKFYMAIKLLDANLKEIKELYRQGVPMLNRHQTIEMIPESMNFCVSGDKIFVERSPEGFLIDVFDSAGKKLYTISKDYERRKVTARDKEIALAYVKENFNLKTLGVFIPIGVLDNGWTEFKKWATFVYPERLTPLRGMMVRDGKLYVRTYNRTEKTEEYLVMDLKGKLLEKLNLPRLRNPREFYYDSLGLGVQVYDIEGDRFYYLHENEDDEEWEVHTAKIR